jgi:hypothetical protein
MNICSILEFGVYAKFSSCQSSFGAIGQALIQSRMANLTGKESFQENRPTGFIGWFFRVFGRTANFGHEQTFKKQLQEAALRSTAASLTACADAAVRQVESNGEER